MNIGEIETMILRDLAEGGVVLDKGINEEGDRAIRFPDGQMITARGAIVSLLEMQGYIKDGRITEEGRLALLARVVTIERKEITGDTEIGDVIQLTDIEEPSVLVCYRDYSLGSTLVDLDDPRLPALLEKWIEGCEEDVHEAQLSLYDALATRRRILAQRAKGGTRSGAAGGGA